MDYDYDTLLQDLFIESGSPSDWCGSDLLPVLKKHFALFEQNVRMQCALDEMPNKLKLKIMDDGSYIPSLLLALNKGAQNPIIKGDDKCPVCANQTEICSYCAKNFEE